MAWAVRDIRWLATTRSSSIATLLIFNGSAMRRGNPRISSPRFPARLSQGFRKELITSRMHQDEPSLYQSGAGFTATCHLAHRRYDGGNGSPASAGSRLIARYSAADLPAVGSAPSPAKDQRLDSRQASRPPTLAYISRRSSGRHQTENRRGVNSELSTSPAKTMLPWKTFKSATFVAPNRGSSTVAIALPVVLMSSCYYMPVNAHFGASA